MLWQTIKHMLCRAESRQTKTRKSLYLIYTTSWFLTTKTKISRELHLLHPARLITRSCPELLAHREDSTVTFARLPGQSANQNLV